jgi:hypothetical protein
MLEPVRWEGTGRQPGGRAAKVPEVSVVTFDEWQASRGILPWPKVHEIGIGRPGLAVKRSVFRFQHLARGVSWTFGALGRSALASSGAAYQLAAVTAAIRIDEAEVALACVTYPARLPEVRAEVERRAGAYAAAWAARPEPPPAGETPRLAALLSVRDDVVSGRLG